MGITGINLKLLEQITQLLNKKKNIPLQKPSLLARLLSNLKNSRPSFI